MSSAARSLWEDTLGQERVRKPEREPGDEIVETWLGSRFERGGESHIEDVVELANAQAAWFKGHGIDVPDRRTLYRCIELCRFEPCGHGHHRFFRMRRARH